MFGILRRVDDQSPFVLLPAIDLVQSLGRADAGRRILQAVEKVLTEGRVRTRDLGGDATTTQVADAIIAGLN